MRPRSDRYKYRLIRWLYPDSLRLGHEMPHRCCGRDGYPALVEPDDVPLVMLQLRRVRSDRWPLCLLRLREDEREGKEEGGEEHVE